MPCLRVCRDRQDPDRQGPGPATGHWIPARAGDARPDACRHSGHHNSAAGLRTLPFHAGPVFTDLLLVDEINRMPPRTQAALLECMEERQVTTDGVRRPLPAWFTVFATQNPVDFEGTYPLPEAQLDRFLLKIRVAYPSESEELQILERHHAGSGAGLLEDASIAPVSQGLLAAARAEVRSIRIEPELYTYILSLARRTREWPPFCWAQSPRRAQPDARGAGHGGIRWARLPGSRRRKAGRGAGIAPSRDAEARSGTGGL